jgi:hypothetical protein
VPLFRHNAFLFAPSICLPQQFSKMTKLPKNACEVGTKHNHVFLKMLRFSGRHCLSHGISTPASSQVQCNGVRINPHVCRVIKAGIQRLPEFQNHALKVLSWE